MASGERDSSSGGGRIIGVSNQGGIALGITLRPVIRRWRGAGVVSPPLGC